MRCWTQRFWTSTLSWEDTTGCPPPPWQALMTLDDVDGNEGRLVNTVFGCCWWDGCLLSNPIFRLQQRYASTEIMFSVDYWKTAMKCDSFCLPRTDSFWKIKQISSALFVSSQRLVFHWKKISWQPRNGSKLEILRVTISTRNGPQDLKVEVLLEGMSDENTEGLNDSLVWGNFCKRNSYVFLPPFL